MTGTPATAAHFDALHARPDPFGYHRHWYEQRKRALLLACLPQARYARGWELGCSNGATTVALAPRCGALLATDVSPRAVALARVAVAAHRHVDVERATHPDDWPTGRFDLIVLGEVGYYLDDGALAIAIDRIAGSLSPGGTLVACHWRAPIDDGWRNGEAVHAVIQARLPVPRCFHGLDADFVLDAWSDGDSPARREGLR